MLAVYKPIYSTICCMIEDHPYIASSRMGRGLPHWWRLMTRGVVGHDDAIQNASYRLNRQYTRVTPKPRILHYHQSCGSVVILFCIYYCIIHGVFQYNSMLSAGSHSFIDISDWYILFILQQLFEALCEIAKSKLAYLTDDVILEGKLDGVWWRGEGGLKIV